LRNTIQPHEARTTIPELFQKCTVLKEMGPALQLCVDHHHLDRPPSTLPLNGIHAFLSDSQEFVGGRKGDRNL
jgi:hypothetical protein